MLEYRARHTGWLIFMTTYWALYLVLLGMLLMFYSLTNAAVSPQYFSGIALVLLGVMLIVMGGVESLHRKLMRKYS